MQSVTWRRRSPSEKPMVSILLVSKPFTVRNSALFFLMVAVMEKKDSLHHHCSLLQILSETNILNTFHVGFISFTQTDIYHARLWLWYMVACKWHKKNTKTLTNQKCNRNFRNTTTLTQRNGWVLIEDCMLAADWLQQMSVWEAVENWQLQDVYRDIMNQNESTGLFLSFLKKKKKIRCLFLKLDDVNFAWN